MKFAAVCLADLLPSLNFPHCFLVWHQHLERFSNIENNVRQQHIRALVGQVTEERIMFPVFDFNVTEINEQCIPPLPNSVIDNPAFSSFRTALTTPFHRFAIVHPPHDSPSSNSYTEGVEEPPMPIIATRLPISVRTNSTNEDDYKILTNERVEMFNTSQVHAVSTTIPVEQWPLSKQVRVGPWMSLPKFDPLYFPISFTHECINNFVHVQHSYCISSHHL